MCSLVLTEVEQIHGLTLTTASQLWKLKTVVIIYRWVHKYDNKFSYEVLKILKYIKRSEKINSCFDTGN